LDKTEYRGSWWLPEKPGTVVTGSLQFGSDGGITLDLQGTLTDNVHHPQSVTLILGHSTEGDTITLYGCIQINFSLGTEGVRTTTFYVSAVLIGVHFQSPEKLAFRRFAVTYPQLDYWFGTSGVHVEFPDTHTLTITKKSSFLVSAECGSTKISPGFLFTTHYGRDEVSVKYVPDFVVEMTNEVPLKQSLKLLHHLRNFLALAVSHPVYPDSIDGFTDSVKATLTDGTTVCRQITDLTQKEDEFDKRTHSYVALIGFTPLNLSSSNKRSLAS
jgi:hypothetical protein